ncbi:HD domain protein [Sphingobacterium spiritivorum ATCC 33300]|uniref:HD domain protein n=1 Tax=Sphingobacterium spiritivorum ATCC 33300 TaxID=525372 RepID=C2G0F2_SPHSI|nr:HD domain-containing protein [Sphingobacterium spiritivorum]EEI91332.1 HD domain protein [Sphingobacterium spiritivorum ATCC 33300]QQS97435.1 HD domain-containing protein [Sphingobacterium spiritivorum]
MQSTLNKRKIVNDPVYGFVTIPSGCVFDLIQHPYFQRLRYIKQVSMTHLVYPGALHTRFQHAIGAMHLMSLAIDTLRSKEVRISLEEEEAALVAILLHDIGHGPFSHSLEHTIIEGVSHEMLSSLLMDRMNDEFGCKLDLAITIFNNKYERKFFHQLVSSQLDTDRMDYLNRDSFFTGVSEGVISFDRIIKMLNVHNDELVVELKGIYSVEKFLIARRLMYWQVYLHKTVIGAEQMLIKALKRAKALSDQGADLFATPAFSHFLKNRITKDNFLLDESHLQWFTRLDDTDIMSAIKTWADHEDKILSMLCRKLMARDLFRTVMSNEPFSEQAVEAVNQAVIDYFGITQDELEYFVFIQEVENSAYSPSQGGIKIVDKQGELKDITEASDLSNLEALARKVRKFAISYPKEVGYPRIK